jgi:hypothetical protein
VFLEPLAFLEAKEKPGSVKQQLVFVLPQKPINLTLQRGTIAFSVLIVLTLNTRWIYMI